ncbi:Uncharacterised protein [Mycobacteroides abscessus subsp. abscessus]|nr:Uncharacterised protein [Mycobacteroides abscessus subsp. abscessus]
MSLRRIGGRNSATFRGIASRPVKESVVSRMWNALSGSNWQIPLTVR